MATITTEKAEAPLILTLDIGSSSIRTILFDRQGRMVAGSEATHNVKLRTTSDGASQADPDALLETLFLCIDQTLAQTTAIASQIRGVASCVFVNNICGVDDAGRVVLPLTTYADTRSAGEVPGLQVDLDEAAVYQRTGCRFHPSYLPARLRWLARTEPERFQRVAHWLSMGDYLALRLFGQAAVSYSIASWSGLLNRYTLTWDKPLIDHLPVEINQLPPLTDVSQPQQGLRPEFAERWPTLRNVPWFPMIGDGAAANIGSGCVTADQIALTIGTTSALRVVIEPEPPPVPEGLWCYRIDGRRSLLGGALSEGGSLFNWLRGTVQIGDLADLNERLTALAPDDHGLTILPFLTGERAPGWAGDVRATIHGLSQATSPVEIVRAGLEAIAYRIGQVFQMLQAEISGAPHLIVSGGALRRWPVWTQIIADVLGRSLLISNIPEASSRGVALLALEALGVCSDLAEMPTQIIAKFEPDPAHHERYQQAIRRQQELYRIFVVENKRFKER